MIRYGYAANIELDPADPRVGAVIEWDDDRQVCTDLTTGQSRPYTDTETASALALTAQAVTAAAVVTMEDRARKALALNAAWLDLTSPTATQNLAHMRRLTRMVNTLVRLRLAELGDGSDT